MVCVDHKKYIHGSLECMLSPTCFLASCYFLDLFRTIVYYVFIHCSVGLEC